MVLQDLKEELCKMKTQDYGQGGWMHSYLRYLVLVKLSRNNVARKFEYSKSTKSGNN